MKRKRKEMQHDSCLYQKKQNVYQCSDGGDWGGTKSLQSNTITLTTPFNRRRQNNDATASIVPPPSIFRIFGKIVDRNNVRPFQDFFFPGSSTFFTVEHYSDHGTYASRTEKLRILCHNINPGCLSRTLPHIYIDTHSFVGPYAKRVFGAQ